MTLGFYNDGTNTVIAESVEDAKAVYAETIGGPWTEDQGENVEWSPGCAWNRKTPGIVSCRFEDMGELPQYALASEGTIRLNPDTSITVLMAEAEWIAGHTRVLRIDGILMDSSEV